VVDEGRGSKALIGVRGYEDWEYFEASMTAADLLSELGAAVVGEH